MAHSNFTACSFLWRCHGSFPHTYVCRGTYTCKLWNKTPKIFCSRNTSSQDFRQLWR